MASPTPLRAIRISCAVLFVASIAGLIISSIAGNNAGWVVSIGLVAVAASIVLIVASLVGSQKRVAEFSDAHAARVELMVVQLVSAGAEESKVRALVKASVQLGRGL